ncbi:ribosome small subunit-dependent GTPase A [Lacrimispora saccharolytica]|uniref:ribosome small subunit-dependent GTPase A n=1 Tax=Lacrimispora saccharolytica TaxID=84030 RepID=UPI00265D0E58|nr:ribosome small subunit-dependent GTPase A [Lacrimispora saccharolytica]MBS7329026.1 ribosome small subunit-dependent GTPase A [Lachnospiraceae bacterium]MCF2656856.1 ribosome small subunit-dependent GTPase A [Lacrimispora saccharolytica]MCI7557247.1 ribosome small subunit-dependent GTPase A [Lachnospiraceae bacterium]
MQGKIIRGIGGFYYINAGNSIYECKAKGSFRKDGIRPLVGDDCIIDILDEKNRLANITSILPRHSEIIRPAVANVDQAMIIFAISRPEPNFNLLDRFIIQISQKDLPCIIVINKMDLADDDQRREIEEAYVACGCRVVFTSVSNREGVEEIRKLIKGKTTTVAGPSGVGKSSMINLLQSAVKMQTGVLSDKIDRGKHTTRHSELIPIDEDTYILDTPGFSSLNLFDVSTDTLKDYYYEFEDYAAECRFLDCKHISEPDCGVKKAVESGEVSRLRYENYLTLYRECKEKRKY